MPARRRRLPSPLLALAAALAIAGPAAAETAAGQAWFYCAGINPATAAMAVTTVFQGSPERLDDYRTQTAGYLESLGLLVIGKGDVACAWAPDRKAAEVDLTALTTPGPGDDPGLRFVRLDWAPKPGETVFARDGAEDLNAAVSRQNAEVQARNDKTKAEYDANLATFAAARTDYERRLAQQQAQAAEAAEAQKKYEAERAAWEARVKALPKH